MILSFNSEIEAHENLGVRQAEIVITLSCFNPQTGIIGKGFKIIFPAIGVINFGYCKYGEENYAEIKYNYCDAHIWSFESFQYFVFTKYKELGLSEDKNNYIHLDKKVVEHKPIQYISVKSKDIFRKKIRTTDNLDSIAYSGIFRRENDGSIVFFTQFGMGHPENLLSNFIERYHRKGTYHLDVHNSPVKISNDGFNYPKYGFWKN